MSKIPKIFREENKEKEKERKRYKDERKWCCGVCFSKEWEPLFIENGGEGWRNNLHDCWRYFLQCLKVAPWLENKQLQSGFNIWFWKKKTSSKVIIQHTNHTESFNVWKFLLFRKQLGLLGSWTFSELHGRIALMLCAILGFKLLFPFQFCNTLFHNSDSGRGWNMGIQKCLRES